jgi:hypothetical protein
LHHVTGENDAKGELGTDKADEKTHAVRRLGQ